MKRTTLLFALFSLFTINASAQQYYYWYQHHKILLKPDSSALYVEFTNRDSLQLFLQTTAGILSLKGDIQQESSKSLIITLQLKGEKAALHRLSPAFSFSSPLLTHNQAKIMLVPQIIVQLKKGYKINTLLSQYKKYLSLKDKIGTDEYLLNVNTHTFERVLTLANKISENNDKVEWCEPDFYNSFHVATDPLYNEQYYLNNTGQNGGTQGIDINAPEAWSITKGSNTVRVAVIGTGVENHEDFNGRVLNGYTAGNPNGNGAPQNANGYNEKAHGEACAGIIAATQDNNIGIKGIDPNVQIIPVNIFPNLATPFDAGAATSAQIAQAINWAYDPNGGNADVLSCSWGGGAPSNAITSAIESAENYGREGRGSIVVFCSGNNIPHQNLWYPAKVNGVIAVGAIHNNGNIWDYSDRGPSLDLVAPSGDVNLNGDVVTTDRMGSLGYNSGNYTTHFGGTSAACPQVAGVACLMLSVNPGLYEYDVRTILQETATDMGSGGFDNTFGYGRVNACEAVGEAFANSDIYGPYTLCNNSPATYSISSTINPNIVTWSATPSGKVSLSPNGDQITVTKLDNGDVTITASIGTSCGSFFTEQQIHVGVPDRPEAYDDPSVNEIRTINICPNLYQHLQIRNLIGILEWDWEKVSGSFHLLPAGQNAQVIGFTPSSGLITVRARNACGWSVPDLILVHINDCNNLFNHNSIKLFPNPASNSVTLYVDNQNLPSKTEGKKSPGQISINEMKIYDSYGNVRIFQKFDHQQKVSIDVSRLENGIFVVEVYTTTGVEYHKLVIQR